MEEQVVIANFLFKNSWKTLEDSLGATPALTSRGFDALSDLLKFCAAQDSCLVLVSVSSKEDLIQLGTFLKAARMALKTTHYKVVVVDATGKKQLRLAIEKFGPDEILDPLVTAKVFRFKIDFWAKLIRAKSKKIEDVNKKLIDKTTHDGVAEDKSLIRSPSLACQSDIWILTRENDCKRIIGRWIVKFMGPGPYIGQWSDVPGKSKLWLFQIKKSFADQFISGEGNWFYRGDQKPEFNWQENRWLMTGDAFELFFNDGETSYVRAKLENKVLAIADNSAYAKSKEPRILASFDRDFVFKHEAEIGDHAFEFENEGNLGGHIQGKIKEKEDSEIGYFEAKLKEREERRKGHLKGKVKENENEDEGHLEGRVKEQEESGRGYFEGNVRDREEAGEGPLKGKVKDRENERSGHLKGSVKEHEESGRGYYEGNVTDNEEAGEGSLKGKVKDEENEGDGHLRGKLKDRQQAGQGPLEGKFKDKGEAGKGSLAGKLKEREEAGDGHLRGQIKDKENEGRGPLEGKLKDREEAGKGPLEGKLKDREEAGKGPLEGKLKDREEAGKGPLEGKLKHREEAGGGPLKGKINHVEDSRALPGAKQKRAENGTAELKKDSEKQSHSEDRLASNWKGKVAGRDENEVPETEDNNQQDRKNSEISGGKPKDKKIAGASEEKKAKDKVDVTEHLESHWGGKRDTEKAPANSKRRDLSAPGPDEVKKGALLQLKQDEKDVQTHYKKHNEAKQYEAGELGENSTDDQFALTGKSKTEKLASHYSSGKKIRSPENKDLSPDTPMRETSTGVKPNGEEENKVLPFVSKAEEKELEKITENATVSSFILQRGRRFECRLDDCFDSTIIFACETEGLKNSEDAAFEVSLNYRGKLVRVNCGGTVMSIDYVDAGNMFVTIEITSGDLAMLNQLMEMIKSRQGSIDSFLSKTKGIG